MRSAEPTGASYAADGVRAASVIGLGGGNEETRVINADGSGRDDVRCFHASIWRHSGLVASAERTLR